MKKRSQLAANGVNRARTIMAGRGRTRLTPQQVDAIKSMVANKKSNGAIATPLGLKESTVAYVATIA